MEQLNDLELIQKFKRGEEQAFNILVSRYQEKVYWVVRRLLPNHDEADDVVQNVFIKAYTSISSFKGESTIFTWLYRIATNLALNEIRRKKLKRTFSIDDSVLQYADPDELPLEQLEKKELTARIQQAIDTLPEKQKKVFVLRYYEELPYEQIAKILKTSVGGLKANYFHAVRKIGAFLKK